ncbi:biotin/lipoyl-binding protein [Microbacterium sp.]|uniref:efflux RND transporter periplasmic adaptor subunit n=1 Tax=Microbacterium sp. TaxID=51671 RepID=UPI0033411934
MWLSAVLLPSKNEAETITRTQAASVETLQQTVTSSGTVSPAINDDVNFAVSGTVTDVAVSEGDVVEKGAVLATVDTLDLNAALLAAKATLAEAKDTLSNANDTNDGSAAAEARAAAASAAVDAAAAAVAEAESDLGEATLRAPAAGLIVRVNVSTGDKITGSSGGSSPAGSAAASGGTQGAPGASSSSSSGSSSTSAAAFTLVSTDSWVVEVNVGETDIANVKTGLQVELTTSDSQKLFGTVTEVGRVPSTSSGAAKYPVKIAITGDGKGLFDGMDVDADIVYRRRTDVLTVPSAAVTTSDGKSTVTVVAKDGAHKKTTVEVGETAGGLTEIISGIKEGDEVLVAEFTPGEGNTGQFPGGGRGGQGGFPGGGLPDGFQPPSGGFPGGGRGGQGGTP